MIEILNRNRQKITFVAASFLIMLILLVIIKNAWLCDDSFISFRTADNFLSGYGLRWNIAERVQSFTNTMWLFTLLPFFAVTGEYYLTVIVISVLMSFAALVLLFISNRNNVFTLLIALSFLLLSSTFIDYSTSGLENPLSHVLIVAVLFLFVRKEESSRNLISISLLMSLAVLNRTDHLLILFPVIVYYLIAVKFSIKAVFQIIIGFLPCIIWTIFSLVYYGYPFPNTAYAKLNSGMERSDLIVQGLNYIKDFFLNDPSGGILLVAAIVILVFVKNRKSRYILSGVFLYLIYIVSIGGDFMSGRFFSILIVVAAFSFTFIKNKEIITRIAGVFLMIVLFSIMFADRNPVLTGSSYVNRKIVNGIADERGYYFRYTGLFNELPFLEKPKDPFKNKGIRKGKLVVKDGVGLSGLNYGSEYYILDRYALSDPLLSRIPFQYPWEKKKFRPGHMPRVFPIGYPESVVSRRNVIEDKSLKKYYDIVKNITREELFSIERFQNILKMNFGLYDHLIDEYIGKRCFFSSELRSDYKNRSLIAPKGIRKGNIRMADENFPGNRFLVYGPYITLKKGKYKVEFEINTSGKDDENIGRVEVFFNRKVKTLKKIINKKNKTQNEYSKYVLFFKLEDTTPKVEFRVFYSGHGVIKSRKIILTKLDDEFEISQNVHASDILFSDIVFSRQNYETTDSMGKRVVYQDQPGVKINWIGVGNRDRFLIDWINPERKVVFSKYIYGSSRKGAEFYPYLGEMPPEKGKWTVKVMEITYLDTSEDKHVKTLTIDIP